ncbi:unnamed protein product [Paramecium sonneborni]|uniref:Uncharacterized protein n=1 Tax=Paramecium sonneborni TaxID=65129 RepID=A0A8S1RPX9_9CILI|nr:unnamed protein product [Paramecium sonneborni]
MELQLLIELYIQFQYFHDFIISQLRYINTYTLYSFRKYYQLERRFILEIHLLLMLQLQKLVWISQNINLSLEYAYCCKQSW